MQSWKPSACVRKDCISESWRPTTGTKTLSRTNCHRKKEIKVANIPLKSRSWVTGVMAYWSVEKKDVNP